MHAKSIQSCSTLCYPMDHSLPGSSVHGILPGKNTGVGCHALLQGLFLTQGLNPCLLHCRRIFLPSEPPGKPWCQHRFLKATSEEARGWTQCLIASHVDKSMLFTWAHISFRSFVTYGQERGPSNFPLRSRFPFCWRNHLAS